MVLPSQLIVADNLKQQAEVTAATLKLKHDQEIAAATQNVVDTKVKMHKSTCIQLEENRRKHRNLIESFG